jgi:hypothetical protein
MAYAMARIYSSSGTIGAEELAGIALKDLAPKLGEGGGLTRYATIVFSDGRLGSFGSALFGVGRNVLTRAVGDRACQLADR